MNPYGGGLQVWDLDKFQAFLPIIAATLVLWFTNMALTGLLAGRKNLDDGAWTVVATFVGPIALLAVLVVPRRERRSHPVEIAEQVPYAGSEWPALPAPPAPITTGERLLGSMLGAGLAGVGALLIAGAATVQPVILFGIIGAVAGGLVGHWLSGTLIDADRNMLIAIGLAGGVLVLSVNALLTALVRSIPVALAGGSGAELLQLALSAPVALAMAVLFPLVTPIAYPGLLAGSLAGGVAWAWITIVLVRRGRSSGSVVPSTTGA